MAWSLPRKVSAALLAILLCTAAATAIFGYSKFEGVLSSLVRSRYSVVVFSIKKDIEDRLALGLPLRQLRQVQDAIEREKIDQPQIQGIEVFDAAGEIIFDTDRGAVGAAVSLDWVQAAQAAGHQTFARSEEDSLIVGLPLVDVLGRVVGAVVLRYPAASVAEEVRPLLAGQARSGLILLAGFAALAVLGTYAVLAPFGRRLAAMERQLRTTMAEGGPPPAPAGNDPFEARFAAFAASTREALEHMQDATQDVGRLDRLEVRE